MENKRIFAIIGVVVGIFWGLKILVGWMAYSEMSEYSGLLGTRIKEMAFNALAIQTLIDGLLLYFSVKHLSPIQQVFDVSAQNNDDLNNDSYKIYLTKKYGIEKNEALGKIICQNKLFDSIDGALQYASDIEKDAKVKSSASSGFDFTK